MTVRGVRNVRKKHLQEKGFCLDTFLTIFLGSYRHFPLSPVKYENMEKSSFWTRVKRLVKAHKITQEKFATYIGVAVSTLKGWIHFNRIPDAVTACDIAKSLGVTVEYLVRENGGKDTEKHTQRLSERKEAAARIKKLALQIGKEAGRIP
jgi:transcriptional regulator with XRE-family HTH domain